MLCIAMSYSAGRPAVHALRYFSFMVDTLHRIGTSTGVIRLALGCALGQAMRERAAAYGVAPLHWEELADGEHAAISHGAPLPSVLGP